MAYEPLHHKYRPQTFQDLVGQTAIATTLSNAIVQQRIAPAYLFSGPRGTGKTSSARILAKSLNCQTQDKPTPQPCGTCEACHSITTGIALDVIEIDAASNTGVDNIRELIEKAQFAPVQCRYKVYVIDECHMLSTAAFNALLKTLEEPPERVVFVLATTDPQRVLPTIISRCQRFDYRRIPLEEMVGHLRHIADQELIDINDDALRLVAQLSQGGLRDAESLLDQLSLLPPPVAIEAVWDLVGAVPERELFTITQAIASNNAEAVIERSRQLMDRGREPLVVLQNLASFYRDLLVARTAPQRNDLVAITPGTWQEMTQFAQQLDIAVILQGQQHLRSSEVQLKNSTQPRLWLEVTLMGLLPAALVQPQGTAMAVAPIATAPPAITAPSAVQPPATTTISPPIQVPAPPVPPAAVQAANSPVIPEQTQPPAAASPSPVQPPAQQPPVQPSAAAQPEQTAPTEPAPESNAPAGIDLGEMWQQVIANVEYRSTQMLLRQQSQLMRFTGSVAHIAVTQQWLSSIQTRQAAIESALAKVAGSPIKVKLDPVAQKPDAPPSNGTATSGGAPAAKAPPAPSPAAPIPKPAALTPQPPVPAPSPSASITTPPTPSVAATPQPPAPTSPAPISPPPTPTQDIAAPPSANFATEAEPSQAPPVEPAAVAAVIAEMVPEAPPSSVESSKPETPQASEPQPDNSEPIQADPGPLEEEVEISIDPMAGLIPLPTLAPLTPTASPEGDSEAEVAKSQAQLAPIGEAGLPPTVKPLWEEDEIVRSAKQLAQFFNGEVVRDEVVVAELKTKDVVVEAVAVPSAETVPAIAPHVSPEIAQSTNQVVTVPAQPQDSADEDDDVPF